VRVNGHTVPISRQSGETKGSGSDDSE